MQAEYEFSRERDESIFYLSDDDGVCPMHFHKKLEVMYVLRGTKVVSTLGRDITLTKDEMYVADSYVMHGYAKSDDAQEIIVVFPNRLLNNYFRLFGDMVLGSNSITDKTFCRKLLPLLRSISDDKVNPLLYQANVDMLLGLLVEKVGVRPKQMKYSLSLIESILNYIEEHYTEELSLDALSAYFGYSKYYFSRLFNSCLGTNISDYISLIRLNKALAILKEKPNEKVIDAAFQCGFSSLQTFYRTLKKNYTYKTINDIIT